MHVLTQITAKLAPSTALLGAKAFVLAAFVAAPIQFNAIGSGAVLSAPAAYAKPVPLSTHAGPSTHKFKDDRGGKHGGNDDGGKHDANDDHGGKHDGNDDHGGDDNGHHNGHDDHGHHGGGHR